MAKHLVQDLYVMRRAIGVYERLVRRFTAQTTDYQVGWGTLAAVVCKVCRGLQLV